MIACFLSVILCTFEDAEESRKYYLTNVLPILEQKCFSCHSELKGKSKGGLILDTQVGRVRGGESGQPAVEPGKPRESLLIKAIRHDSDVSAMPPSGEKLSTDEIAKIEKWIELGAKCPTPETTKETWWSLAPIRSLSPPEVPSQYVQRAKNPIDAFVLAKLESSGISPSEPADRRTLIRRLYFDLLGLPPSPERVLVFVQDPSESAYEKLVDELLASPAYGERWARHWLDVVHFGETHGYDKDQPRPNAWPYRDYVIRAFNNDKPYSRFIKEQVSGDILFPGTRDGIEALGFIAAGPWDLIGHAELPEEKLDGKVARHLDRDDMVANTIGTFCSLTVHCAQCHHHKFDPITMQDYFGLQAVYSALDRTDVAYDADPLITRIRADLKQHLSAVSRELDALEATAKRRAGRNLLEVYEQIKRLKAAKIKVHPIEHGWHSGISSKQNETKWVQIDLGKSIELSKIILRPCFDDFNGIGEGFGFPVRFRVEISQEPMFDKPDLLVDYSKHDFTNPKLAEVTIDATGKTARYLRVTATKLAPRVNDYIFALSEVEAMNTQGLNLARKGVVTSSDSIEALPRWSRANLIDGIWHRSTGSVTSELAELDGQRTKLLDSSISPADRSRRLQLQAKLKELENKLKSLPPQQYVYAGGIHTGTGTFRGTGVNGGKPREIRVLKRGNVADPGAIAAPSTIAALDSSVGSLLITDKSNEGHRRAALAEWIAHKNHPLTWRSIVNRIWQYHFGRGLVDSPNDFGRMGELPSHPDLLDWLANDFRSSDGSIKRLQRLIVTSATYQQASHSDDKVGIRKDSGNRLIWRMKPRKLEAEAVRDSLLAVANKLDRRMGGPSYRDFLIERPEHSPHYQYHLVDPSEPEFCRRTVYRFLVRSKPNPWMAALDCADASQRVDKRPESLSPLQALAQLNNQLVLSMSRHLADRVTREIPTGNANARLDRIYQLALQRNPSDEERIVLRDLLASHGLPAVCRTVFNLNEFVFVD